MTAIKEKVDYLAASLEKTSERALQDTTGSGRADGKISYSGLHKPRRIPSTLASTPGLCQPLSSRESTHNRGWIHV